MVALVTLERVKQALRIDTTDDDQLLNAYIAAASAAVINYLKGQAQVLLGLDEDGELPSEAEIPPEIELATIMLVGHFYKEPDGNTEDAFEQGYLPKPVTALLYPLRDPTLA